MFTSAWMSVALAAMAALAAGWFSLSGLYAFCFVVGLGYTVLAAVLGSLGGDAGGHDVAGAGHDLGDFGHDLDVSHDLDLTADHGEVAFGHHGEMAGGAHLGPFSPLIIALFLTCFGGTGLLFTLTAPLGSLSLLPAVGSSFAFAALAIWAFNRLFARVEATSQARACDLIGRQATVITPIPEGPGAGTVAYVINGTRYTMVARSEDAAAMDRGAEVVILRIVGQGCFVVPVADKRGVKAAERLRQLESVA